MARITRVMVPTDFSAPVDAALDYARDLAKQFGARVNLVHVFDDPFVSGAFVGDGTVMMPVETREALENQAREELARRHAAHTRKGRRAMKVKDVMTTDVKTCTPDTTVAEAAKLMWDGDCGILPVVDDGALIGVVTDRDMFIALGIQNERAARLRVGAVATATVAACPPDDDLQTALAMMRHVRVRRLPVVGFGNSLLGMISINDIVMATAKSDDVSCEDVVRTLQAICALHHPAPHVVAA